MWVFSCFLLHKIWADSGWQQLCALLHFLLSTLNHPPPSNWLQQLLISPQLPNIRSSIPPSGASDVLRLLCCATHHSVFMKNPIILTWCYKIAMFHHVKCLYGGFYETHLVGSWSGASPWQQRWPSAPFENDYYSILSLYIFLFVYILNWKYNTFLYFRPEKYWYWPK